MMAPIVRSSPNVWVCLLATPMARSGLLCQERGAKDFGAWGARLLTLGVKVGPAVVGELDRLLERLHQVAVA